MHSQFLIFSFTFFFVAEKSSWLTLSGAFELWIKLSEERSSLPTERAQDLVAFLGSTESL